MTIVAVVLAAVLVGGCGSGNPRQDARSYIHKMHTDAARVQAAVDVVLIDVGGKQSADQIAQDAQSVHDTLDGLHDDFAEASGDGGKLGDDEAEAFAAEGDLRDAMHDLVTYAGTPNAATLARFTDKYQTARAEWNDSIRWIWRIAGERHAPTI